MRNGLVLGLVAFLALAVPVAAGSWEQELSAALSGQDSTKKHQTVLALDPSDKKALKYLFTIVEKEEWYVREAAMAVLGRAQGEALEEVRKTLKKGSLREKEGIALGFGEAKRQDCVPDLIAALDDKAFEVRYATTLSLGKLPDKAAIPALLKAWKEEKDERLPYVYGEALKAITKEDIGQDIVDWENWWKGRADEFDPAKKKEGEGAAEGEAKKEGGTVLRDVDLTFTESGTGGPLFVLAEYGYENSYLVPAMKALEDSCRVFYIDLPTIDKFKDLKTVGGTGLVEYPIDKLCDAFDELRKARKQDRIAILGHGITGWIAMRYATKYPENVSHIILVSTWTGGNAWGRGRNNVETDGKTRGIVEQEHFAQTLLIDMASGKPNYQPQSEAEGLALQRMRWTTYFNDRCHGMAAIMHPEVERQMPGCLIPQFEAGKEKGSPVPTLIIFGKQSLWTDANDMRTLAKIYPNSQLVECPSSSMLPMVEDFKIFTKSIEGFFKKFKFKQTIKGGK